MIGMGGGLAVAVSMGFLVDDDSINSVVLGRKESHKVRRKSLVAVCVAQRAKNSFPVYHLFSVEDNRFIGAMREMRLFKFLELGLKMCSVEFGFNNDSGQAEVAGGQAVQMMIGMIARLININPVSFHKVSKDILSLPSCHVARLILEVASGNGKNYTLRVSLYLRCQG